MLSVTLRQSFTAAIIAAVPVAAGAQTFPSSAGPLKVETVARGLNHPWSLAFLPGGRMLVTERAGRIRIVAPNGDLSKPLDNVPGVHSGGQAGLLDVALDRDFAGNGTIYFCFNAAADNNVAVVRARLDAAALKLDDVKVIFRQKGPAGRANVACRIAQGADGNLFVSLGDHFGAKELAQKLDNAIGKVVRIKPEGGAAAGNPFVGRQGALPEIWAYGVRNPEGLAFNPADGQLWEQEHGPMGGDEINIIGPGKNYGWPVVSYGVNYDGSIVGTGKQTAEGIVDPVWHWTPSIAPSGMAFYTGELFPAWKGSLFNGALKFQLLSRLEIKDGRPVKEERLLQDLKERIRDVRQGPDGALYLLTDNEAGRILRVVPGP
ncbi:MAG: PQQ-dependent sugar dehydrogenase [Proteobacteria bacterium]|nr:PQQ-dependent sugar dehydrogenase [Pseudomonadota bacterium]